MPTEAEEVAEDYRHALEDLSSNARFEISNLTVIARENTEHALLIAEVLEKHILKTAPSKKLPALYVLDSIVKNVGTPYTLYLGRNLFKTFMEAYTVVDNGTRKRMEEMLKTWKQPVAGSMDTRPVFSPDLVRPIENALMKAKAAMIPQAQLPGRPRSALPPHRDTPTPPGMRSAGGTPGNFPSQPYPYPHGAQAPNGHYPPHPQVPYPQHAAPQPASSSTAPFQPPLPGAYGLPVVHPTPEKQAGVNVETLGSDIQNMIVATRVEASLSPHDASVQTKLRALLDLQGIVQSQSLPQDQLELIKNEVTKLTGVKLGAQNPSSTAILTHTPTPPPPAAQQQQQFAPPPAPSSVTPSSAPPAAAGQGSLTLDSLLGAGALATLMGRTPSQNSTPNPPNAAIRSPQPAQATPHAAPPAHPPAALSLMEQLRLAGLIQPTTPTNAGAAAAPPPAPTVTPNLASLLAAQQAPAARPHSRLRRGLDSTSLKQPRPDILHQVYERLGPPCTQCGRRFQTDQEGRKKKTAHMDWHFRVHQRGNEAEKRGTHRSWYVDLQEWGKSRESVDSDQTAAAETSAAEASKAAAEAAKPKYIAVPDPKSGINNVCPICQDRFENTWLDTAQEWVWLDAVLVRGRAYHASCHAEATRDRDEGTPRRTPEPVLGKRKAEGGLASPKVRSLKTFA